MKKLILALLMLIGIGTANADVWKFSATHLAYKFYDYDYNRWPDWSDWEDTKILIVVDTDKERVTIYSSTPQQYDIYQYGQEEEDSSGGSYVTFKCVDAEGTQCDVTLRRQYDGRSQMYVEYADAAWVYVFESR